jgi:hypothetical protein
MCRAEARGTFGFKYNQLEAVAWGIFNQDGWRINKTIGNV